MIIVRQGEYWVRNESHQPICPECNLTNVEFRVVNQDSIMYTCRNCGCVFRYKQEEDE